MVASSVPEVPAEKDPPVPRPNSQTPRHRPLHRPTVYARTLPSFDDVLLLLLLLLLLRVVLSVADDDDDDDDDASSLSSSDFDPPLLLKSGIADEDE